jgi:hypothetical protein
MRKIRRAFDWDGTDKSCHGHAGEGDASGGTPAKSTALTNFRRHCLTALESESGNA